MRRILAIGSLASALAFAGHAAETPATGERQDAGRAGDTPSLPFSIKVTEEKFENPPVYMNAGNPLDMDFPYCPVEMDGEYWIIYKNGYNNKVCRFKGSNIENATREPDGSASFPVRGPYMLGGMWYDAGEKKLYAPMHCETFPYGSWVERQVHLATSTDKGLTWKYEGAIMTRDDPKLPHRSPPEFSGLQWDGSDADFHLYVDERSGYFYLYTLNWLKTKAGVPLPCFVRHCVARCAITDKMAPGKWWKFYHGAWDQPGLGGKASYVTAYRVSYNTYLKKYISFNCSSGVSFCDDLAKQEWSPSYHVGNYWCMDAFGYWAVDEGKTNVNVTGKSLYVYGFWQKRPGRRFHVVLDAGAPTTNLVFSSPSTRWEFDHTVSLNPGQQYSYTPMFESSDAIDARRTRRVDCSSPETKFAGTWSENVNPSYYNGHARTAVAAGASIEFTFAGPAIYWRAVQGPDMGKADVFVDNVLQATVDCWASAPNPYLFTFIKQGLSDGWHTIKVVVRGEKGPWSSGTAIRHMLFEYAADTWRASDCFSSVQGKNQWRYQQDVDGTVTDLAGFQDPNWKGRDGCEIGYFHMTPGGKADAVRSWTASHDGLVRIEGAPALVSADTNSVVLSIRKGTASLWSARLIPAANPAASHDLTVTVRAGEVVCFIAGKLQPATKPAPKVIWDPAITYLNTPKGFPAATR